MSCLLGEMPACLCLTSQCPSMRICCPLPPPAPRRALDLPALEQLVQRLDSAAAVRNVLTERRIEAARSEMGAAAAATCCVCCEAPRDTVLSCGHIICRRCSDRLLTCPVC